MSSPSSHPSATPLALPDPLRDRWQPLRSGLLNLYRYDYEEFHYEQGRLLLRGNNGTGKSRVLALQLPFLLDGEVAPGRVEPDGDMAKRIEWNLLMGRYPDRTGYTWIEFGRRQNDGSVTFVTLGCGMRAVAGHTGLHSRWLFVTSRRIGRDLFLQNAQNQPYGQARLTELIGTEGNVFTRAEDYRRAVDQALFGLGTRYGSLLELLIRLRRPQLSRKLDEAELSQALSDALPTLPSTLIEEIAEAFRSLQSDREALRGFSDTRGAVDHFLRDYALYARVAVRRRATAVRSAHSAYEEAQRQFREAERRSSEAEAELLRLSAERSQLNRDEAGAAEAVATLRASPEMRTATEIDQARHTAATATATLEQTAADLEQSSARAAAERERLAAAEADVDKANTELEATLRATEAQALEAEFATEHRSHVPAAGEAARGDTVWVKRAEPALQKLIQRRRQGVVHLRALEEAAAQAHRVFLSAEEERIRASNASTAAREAEHAAREALKQAGEQLLASYASWRAGLRVLAPAEPETLADAFAHWLEQRQGHSPLRTAIDAAHRQTFAEIGGERAAIDAALAENSGLRREVDAEIASIAQGGTVGPVAPPTRRAERQGRPGAPFWRLCDFRADTPEGVQAGVEAALEASGLLDAWVLPGGRMIDPVTEDIFFREAKGPADTLPSEHSLAGCLVPAIDPNDPQAAAVTVQDVENLLGQIGLGDGEGSYWVSSDGRWRLGPVTGRWTKPHADFIGESTRAANRRRRLEQLQTRLAELAHEAAGLTAQRVELDQRQTRADAEAASAPDEHALRAAAFALEHATRQIAETFSAHEKAERIAREKRVLDDNATQRLQADADDLGLRRWLGELHALDRAVADYTSALARLWPTVRWWEKAMDQLQVARQRADEGEAIQAQRTARFQAAAETAAAARTRFETLQETHGASVADVLARLQRTEEGLQAIKAALETNRAAENVQTASAAKANADREHASAERNRHEDTRRQAVASLQRFAEERLLAEADARLAQVETTGWPVSRAVEVAREIEPFLADTPADEEAWRRRQDRIHGHVQELRDRLIAHGHQPETHQLEDLVLVRCVFQGRPHTMTELSRSFAAEVAERERLLAAREQEIIENHLLGEIATELQRLVRGAETWIDAANRELAARPTSTGVRFKFSWEPEPEGEFAGVRKAFLRTSELWTPSERTALTGFLQNRIRAEQTANENGSWRDHLTSALDYRRWHRFVVERQQDGIWRRLDKRTYGTGSGGEKALALTLPRFAAAAAHYRSARADAPRLVMLDEAFAGIDPTMRAQCMGVLAQFDLDVVMTSENEWGCYPTVPGLAIYHLTAIPGIDAVSATRWIWNGRERRQRDALLPPVSTAE